jgi:C4-dicarboxylate transporter, DctM subunit
MTAVLVIGIVVLALVGAPIFAIMGAFCVLGALSVAPGSPLADAMGAQLADVFALATSEKGNSLAVIPLFTFMGYILAESQTAVRLVRFARAALGWFPGGLAIVTIVVCSLFTVVTGASGVTIIAVGGLVLPSLIKEGYKERFSLGLVTATGSVGLLFPPALPLVIYGIIAGISLQATASSAGDTIQTSDFDLGNFMKAGIVPGCLLCGSIALYAVYIAIRHRVPRARFDVREALASFGPALPELLIPVVMLGLWLGLGLQIPEAAVFTCLYVVVLETFVYRDIQLRAFPRLVMESMRLVGAIFILIFAATALTNYFVNAHIPDRMTDWLIATFKSKVTFLLMLNVILLAVGSVMDIFSALLVVVPLVVPAAAGFGIDPYHLGIIFLLNLEIGYVHPPVGLNLFISSFRFRKPMNELYVAVLPFLLIMVVVLLVVTYVPALIPIKSKTIRAQGETPTQPVAAAAPSDAGPVVRITFPDGGVWTRERCEKPEIKDEPLEYENCKLLFATYARCEKVEDELEKLDCRQAVLEGKDPFAADAGR